MAKQTKKIDAQMHRIAFERFDDFLTQRQHEVQGEDGTDIRDKMMSMRMSPWAIGYAAFNIHTAYAANMRQLFPKLMSIEDPAASAAQHRLLMGTIYADPAHSHVGSQTIMQDYRPGHDLILGEQGFLASTHSWSEAMRLKDPGLGCLGYVYDDVAYYFMADYPNRLIHRLNSAHEVSPAETARARGLIDRIVAGRVSKYNSQPLAPPTMTRGYSRRVLVCDQTFADASTIFGRIDEAGFEAMLLAALEENPDAEILVKTHPDAAWEPENRTGYYTHLTDTGRVRILRAPMNPYLLFDQVDKVYVGTSQLGLEALFAGKEVVCFGAPFYAGWGLTDDRQQIPHRHRTRTLEDIFHIFYIWYTIYHVPGASQTPARIEDALDYIEEHRPVRPPEPRWSASETPKVSVIVPVYDVEAYIEPCLRSVQAQSLSDIEIITINDRSPDQSQAVIDRLAAEDPRIRPIVLEKNIGQGFARNIGLEAARGAFVWFLDSDDFMPSPDHLRQVYDCAQADSADMVRGRKLFEQIEDADGVIQEMKRDRCEIYFDTPFHGATLATEKRILRSRHFCNWLYRRAMLDQHNIRFLTAQWEERPFLLRALLSAGSISSTTSEAFVYRIRQASTARRRKTASDSFNQLANLEQVSAVLKEFGAYQPDSPLRYVAGFMLMQAVHILFNGFAYRTVRATEGRADTRRFVARVAKVIEASGLGFDDMVFDAPQISRERLGDHSYRLLFEALRQRRFKFVESAVNQTALRQETVMEALLKKPATPDEAAFQTALSLYARNERVTTATDLAPVTKKPRLILHVGQTKTGSTYIQHFLEQNRPALLRAGVWVPDTGLFWQPTRPHKQAGHGNVTREAVTQGSAIRDHIEAALSLAGGQIHTVILSSEAYFLNRRSALIPDHFNDYHTEMIGYFRRQDDWANSQYAEFVAGGAMGRVAVPFADWIAAPVTRERLDYFSYCQMWAARLGPENVHVRIYDRDRLKGGDVVSDFLATLGLDSIAGLERPDQHQANDMPFNTAHAVMLREINGYEWPETADYLDFVQDVSERVAAAQAGPEIGTNASAVLITPDERTRLLADLADTNAAFARQFCPDGQGFAPLAGQAPASPCAQETILRSHDVAAIYDALADYETGDKLSLSKLRAQSQEPAPAKPAFETAEELRALRGILLDIQGLPQQVARGAEIEAEITVFNLTACHLPTRFLGNAVTLSYHILDKQMGHVVWDGVRSHFPDPIDHQYRGPLQITAPDARGVYLVQAGLVFEGQRWFESPRLWEFKVT